MHGCGELQAPVARGECHIGEWAREVNLCPEGASGLARAAGGEDSELKASSPDAFHGADVLEDRAGGLHVNRFVVFDRCDLPGLGQQRVEVAAPERWVFA